MKKLLTIIATALILTLCLGLFAACGGNETCTQHEDGKDDNVLCDKCGVSIWASYEPITVEQAIIICNQTEGTPTTERYYLAVKIDSVTNAAYGAMTVSDATGTIDVYGSYSQDGEIGYAALEEKPFAGDWVLLHCTLQTYNGTPEVKNARIIDFNTVEADISEYTEMPIHEAREAATGTNIITEGVVLNITYANGMKPMGVMLYDVETSYSIYVYDADIAGRVTPGEFIKIAASKTYWVLGTEQENADKFGYKGCNQLEKATLIETDNGTRDVLTTLKNSGAMVNTVKAMLDTPVTEDISSQIFAVTAVVKEVPGTGFTNYYVFDLDYSEEGGTGAYTYTQCNGSDFEWLRQYDGKVCTVYLTLINAKSTATDCFWRILPVAVEEQVGYQFNVAGAPAHALNYYAFDQFMSEYGGNPELEVITSVSSSFLGFEGVEISYTSSDDTIISFDVVDGKTVMNCHKAGEAEITMTATYGEYTATKTKTITVNITTIDVEAGSVKSAIDAESGTTVTVKGIVGPGAVNQSAFYLIDETGSIPVKCDATVFAGLAIGHEVIVTGTRTVTKEGGGQICIDNGTILQNNYGKHAYSTESFITDKTATDIKALTDTPAETVKVYVIKASIEFLDFSYYTQAKLTSDGVELLLYTSSAAQYSSWLEEYAGQELTIEYAICDWNAKGLKGCILSATTADGTVVYNQTNFTA